MNRKFRAILLCVLVATLVALAACQNNSATTGPCPGHTDQDGDGLCDNCGIQVGFGQASTSTGVQNLEVAFSVRDDYGEAMAGATIIIQDRYGSVNLTGTVGEDGIYRVNLDLGEYTVMVEDLPDYHLVGVYNLTVEEGMSPVQINVIDNTPNGTMEKPFHVVEEPCTQFFNTSETFYFSVRGGYGKYLVVENADAEVTLDGRVYTPDEDNKITVRVASEDTMDQILITVANKSADGQEITVQLFADPGTAENPFQAQIGQSYTAHVVGEHSVYYLWTATADGTLTVTSTSGINSITLFNMETSRMSGPTEGAQTLSLDQIKAGDVIRIQVDTSTQATEPENDVEFTLSFE